MPILKASNSFIAYLIWHCVPRMVATPEVTSVRLKLPVHQTSESSPPELSCSYPSFCHLSPSDRSSPCVSLLSSYHLQAQFPFRNSIIVLDLRMDDQSLRIVLIIAAHLYNGSMGLSQDLNADPTYMLENISTKQRHDGCVLLDSPN